jgi:hypothetical protein
MNLETILMCAKMAATQQRAALSYVDDAIVELIAEVESLLVPVELVEEAPVAEKPPAKTTTKTSAKVAAE